MGTLATVTLGFIVIGILLPSTWEAEAERTIAAPPEAIFPLLEEAGAWSAWTPSPESGLELFGPARGEGGGFRWDDPGYGKGSFTLRVVEPGGRIAYAVDVEGGTIRIEGALTLTPANGGTQIVWRESGDFGWNPLLGYMAGRMATLQGEQLAFALVTLEEEVLRRLESDPPSDTEAGVETETTSGSGADPGSVPDASPDPGA
jgi:uncharacterized protein YndB with AHSA1/START domain